MWCQQPISMRFAVRPGPPNWTFAHLDTFHNNWTKMYQRCTNSTKPVAAALRNAFESVDVKEYFFLTTLPDEMENVIDNIVSKDVTRHSAIESKMLSTSNDHSPLLRLYGLERCLVFVKKSRRGVLHGRRPNCRAFFGAASNAVARRGCVGDARLSCSIDPRHLYAGWRTNMQRTSTQRHPIPYPRLEL